jgi:hypothetical protein
MVSLSDSGLGSVVAGNEFNGGDNEVEERLAQLHVELDERDQELSVRKRAASRLLTQNVVGFSCDSDS